MATPYEYYNLVIGKGFDTDGYGYQCVAGFKHWCKTQIGLDYYHKSICYGGNPNGYAYRIWYNFDSLGLGKYFDKVPSNQMVDGDWAIWNFGSRPCPYSHIAMFRKDNGNGTGVFLGQNQNTNNARYTQVNISYNGVLGALRPKIYHNKPIPKPADQVLYPGSKVRFYGTQIDYIDKRTDTFTSCFYTGNGRKNYHLLPLGPFYRVDTNGNRYSNQVVSVGNWVKNDTIYTVKKITKDSALLNVSGKDVWVFSRCLEEISNN